MTHQLSVNLTDKNYSIVWTEQTEDLKKLITDQSSNGKHCLITNTKIDQTYKKMIEDLFPNHKIFIIPDGEEQKSLGRIESLSNEMLKSGVNRSFTFWALGGGVIGDITGFLSSIYMRGVPYFQVPTTLLSMVDSSVGGKTGVNIDYGKNMIGTFYQPEGVFIHTPFLETLEHREILCGLSEVVKTGLIGDPSIIEELEVIKGADQEFSNEFFHSLSRKSVAVKATIVEKDEKESSLRAVLNFGHTLAHALESYYQYSHIKHGEAVSVGIAFALYLGEKLGYTTGKGVSERVSAIFKKIGMFATWKDLPSSPLPKPEAETLVRLMAGDKKNIDNQIRFVFIEKAGKSLLPIGVDADIIQQHLKEFICL